MQISASIAAMSVLLPPLALALASLSAPQSPTATERAAAATIESRIEAIRAKAGIPALGAAVVALDGLQGVWVAGTRRAGGTEKVERDDQWHLGSCTKSMTATLIALLATRGDLEWDTPIGECFSDLATEMDVGYLDVTIVDLMCHRAGLAPNPSDLGRYYSDARSLPEQRAAVARSMLRQPPVHPPKGELLYSNAGFILAGHVAEVATGKSWEELIRTLLFEPLGMTSAGFGAPGTEETCDQPRGHGPEGMPVKPGPMADNAQVLGPAGTVHMSLADWAKYVQLHMKGCRGDVKVGEITLTRETFARLHTPYPGPEPSYGYGWGFAKQPWAGGDGTCLGHNGSNTMWFCQTWFSPERGLAALVTTNDASTKAKDAVDEVTKMLLQELQWPASAAAR